MLEVKDTFEKNALIYAAEVNENRAIPAVEDGLKPVQRRILWTMWKDKCLSTKPHVKCAKISGAVLRFHPHGDTSVYQAMARMAQPFSLNPTLIEFHGSYGSQRNHEPASSRYTEARLTPFTEQNFFEGIKKRAEFQMNFSEDEEEPINLPQRVPYLLLTSQIGIGYGAACHWIPWKAEEIINVYKKFILTEQVDYNLITTPSFPTGGIVSSKDNYKSIFYEGKGTVWIESKWHTETRGKKNLIVFTELPFEIEVESIEESVRKAISENNWDLVVRDETDMNGIRFVIEYVSGNSDEWVEKLFSKTKLKTFIAVNQMALVNKVPRLLNWHNYFKICLKNHLKMIQKEYKANLEQTKKEMLKTSAMIAAVKRIDEVVEWIKTSEDTASARLKLQKELQIIATQADEILAMPLKRLTKLDSKKLETDLFYLEDDYARQEMILSSKAMQKDLIIQDLDI